MIILIGGGEIRDKETIDIDRYFINLCGGGKATIGFFPTAADDSEGYIKTFTNYYLDLGCPRIVPLRLNCLDLQQVKKIISQLTGIYLGGGSTKLLVKTFKQKGIDVLFKDPIITRKMVFAGMSAGALAMCDYYLDPNIENGLGFQHSALCLVHYQEDRDKEKLVKLQKQFPKYKIFGIEEKKALIIDNEKIGMI